MVVVGLTTFGILIITRAWSVVIPVGNSPLRRSEHSAAVLGNTMWVFGGQVYTGTTGAGVDLYSTTNELWAYHFLTQQWEQRSPANPPPARKDHTAVWFGHSMFIYGGVNTAFQNLTDLWRYTPGVAVDTTVNNPRQEVSAPQAQATVIVNILFTLAVLFFHVWQFRKSQSAARS